MQPQDFSLQVVELLWHWWPDVLCCFLSGKTPNPNNHKSTLFSHTGDLILRGRQSAVYRPEWNIAVIRLSSYSIKCFRPHWKYKDLLRVMHDEDEDTAKTRGIESKTRPKLTSSRTRSIQDKDWKESMRINKPQCACMDFWKKYIILRCVSEVTPLMKRKDELAQNAAIGCVWRKVANNNKVPPGSHCLLLKSPPIRYIKDDEIKTRECWGRDETT